MFHFPALPPPALCVQTGVTSNYARQVSLFGNPRIDVWLPTPRGLSQAPTSFFGSWCQGIHRVPLLTWRLQLMLASTVQFSRYGRSRRAHHRVTQAGRSGPRVCSTPVPSGPNSVLGQAVAAATLPVPKDRTNWLYRRSDRITSAPQMSCHPEHSSGHGSGRDPARGSRQVLLRKEVIQPHLPVRLPCYDFVPIADPTFDGSLPKGLGHRLRVLPTFVT